jgi:hypothetical protein
LQYSFWRANQYQLILYLMSDRRSVLNKKIRKLISQRIN